MPHGHDFGGGIGGNFRINNEIENLIKMSKVDFEKQNFKKKNFRKFRIFSPIFSKKFFFSEIRFFILCTLFIHGLSGVSLEFGLACLRCAALAALWVHQRLHYSETSKKHES